MTSPVSYTHLRFTGQMILWSVKKETDIRRGRHCVFLMHVHLVFVTRYRRQIFDYDATEKLRTYFSNVCADFETELVEMDGEPDHVHLLINYPPKLAISSLVNLSLIHIYWCHWPTWSLCY